MKTRYRYFFPTSSQIKYQISRDPLLRVLRGVFCTYLTYLTYLYVKKTKGKARVFLSLVSCLCSSEETVGGFRYHI